MTRTQLQITEHIIALEDALNRTLQEAVADGLVPMVVTTPRPDGGTHVHVGVHLVNEEEENHVTG